MADDDYPLSYLPPMRFDPFMGRSLMRKGGAGGGASLTWGTGYPYDLMEDLPPVGEQSTTSARGGAVKYMQGGYPGVFPQIDRYFAFVAKEEEVSLWGYVKQAAEWNWKVVIPYDGKKVEQTLFNSTNTTYLGTVIKDLNKESSVWGYNESGKRNYRMVVDDDEAKLEAWEANGPSDSKYIIATTKDWPESVAGNTRNKRLVLASESYKDTKPQTVKLRELELDLPKGCPFDLTFAINEDSNSAVGAVKHTGCSTINGEKVGTGVFERYAAANADAQKTGFTAYYGVSEEGYIDVATKGQAETYVWGYADQGEVNFRSQAFGYDAKTEVYHTNGNEYASLSYTTADSGAYGFHGTEQKYWRIYATNTRPEMQLWTGDGRAWASAFAQPAESAFYGWSDTQQSLCRMRAIPFKGQVELWRSDGQAYALMEHQPGEASFYCFSNNQAFNFKAATTPGNTDKAEMSVWANGNSGYAVVGTKGQAETYLWGYADQGDTNVRLRAFGSDASLEAWNDQEDRAIYLNTKEFPSTSSGTTKKRLVAASESYSNGGKPTIVQLRELELGIPHGCPFDLIFNIADSSDSATGAVKHTGCQTVDGELVGNGVYEKYAAAKADSTQSGFVTYYGTGQQCYLDNGVKIDEAFTYGYADDSTGSYRVRAKAFRAELELMRSDNSNYGLFRNESFATSLFMYASDQVYNIKAAADSGADSSYYRAYGASSNVFASMHTQPDKASTWGYSNNQQNVYTNEASADAVFWRGSMSSSTYNTLDVKPEEAGAWGFCSSGTNQYTAGAKATEVFYRTQLSTTYNSMDAKSSEAGNWGYISSGSNQYTLGAQSGEVFVRAQLSQSFVGISTKSATADIWGYTSSEVQWKCEASSSQSKCQTFNSSGWAQISATSSQVSFDASLNNDFSYLTQNTLRVEYGSGDHSTLTPGDLYVNYNSGAYSRLFGGGVYVNNGSNWVNIEPPGGKDAYFQQVEVCINGEPKTAYVLMSDPE